jgi:archaellum component FlaG (FlaF/FlaG flagellin family)
VIADEVSASAPAAGVVCGALVLLLLVVVVVVVAAAEAGTLSNSVTATVKGLYWRT